MNRQRSILPYLAVSLYKNNFLFPNTKNEARIDIICNDIKSQLVLEPSDYESRPCGGNPREPRWHFNIMWCRQWAKSIGIMGNPEFIKINGKGKKEDWWLTEKGVEFAKRILSGEDWKKVLQSSGIKVPSKKSDDKPFVSKKNRLYDPQPNDEEEEEKESITRPIAKSIEEIFYQPTEIIAPMSIGSIISSYPECFELSKKMYFCENKFVGSLSPAKSGKRRQKQILSLLYNLATTSNCSYFKSEYVHIYISSLNRIDCHPQLNEFSSWGFKVLLLKNHREIPIIIDWMKNLSKNENKLIIHLDEGDYGTHCEHMLDPIIDFVGKEKAVEKLAIYSATLWEVIFGTKNITFFVFSPNENYRGLLWFKEHKLLRSADKFFDLDIDHLTDQGKECCNLLKNSGKAFGIVRFTRGMKFIEENVNFNNEIKQYGIIPIYIDAKRKFNWTVDWQNIYQQFQNDENPRLLIICQTCTRSTEVGFHKHIAFWHDYRTQNSPIATTYQAIARINHYHQVSEDENNIQVYSNLDMIECIIECESMKNPTANDLKQISEKYTKMGYKMFQRASEGITSEISTWNKQIDCISN